MHPISSVSQHFQYKTFHKGEKIQFVLGLPPKVPSKEKLILARLGVSRTIYLNVDSPNLGFLYILKLFRGGPVKNTLYNSFFYLTYLDTRDMWDHNVQCTMWNVYPISGC